MAPLQALILQPEQNKFWRHTCAATGMFEGIAAPAPFPKTPGPQI